jgi:hypothetical protein
VPYRDSKPKLARYTSLFSSFKETTKPPEFSEPWNEEAPQAFQSYVDPLHVAQSVRSHIVNSHLPIPSEHHSGLLRLFESYRTVLEQKECLEMLLEETLRDWAQAQVGWTHFEDRYSAEIRRLELLIARGTSGLAGSVHVPRSTQLVLIIADLCKLGRGALWVAGGGTERPSRTTACHEITISFLSRSLMQKSNS